MSIVNEAKKQVKQNQKEATAMKNKTIIETTKTIAITVLVTAIFTFICGFNVGRDFEKEQTRELTTNVKSITTASVDKLKK